MLFSGLTFLYCFLPAVLGVYFLVPRGWKNAVLLLFSLAFYAWGEPKYVLLMGATILCFYLCGLAMGRFPRWKRLWLTVSVLLGLGALGIFKYADFFIGSFNAVTGLKLPLLRLALPIGISFYTFQCISYTVDVYRGKAEPQRSLITFGAYVSLFPQLIAGPIVRYTDVARELEHRQHSWEDFALGLRRFLFGLGKKVLLANQFGELTHAYRNASEPSVLFGWLYGLAFMLQIYFDFSGYSDMAIGLGHIFGFTFPENFNYPYISRSITEFWRRWHMSLGAWFRDYVYIPLGGSRRGRTRQLVNILIVWTLTGLWHGAAWNFVVWGLYFALLLILEKLFLLRALERAPRIAGHIYTLVLVVLGWVLFNSSSLSHAAGYLAALFRAPDTARDVGQAVYYLHQYLPEWLCCVLFSLPAGPWLRRKCEARVWYAPAVTAAAAVLFLLSLLSVVSSSFNPFIYFRF
ncbi:MAG: MBOAT family protein [Clostridiaceae bacterium]|nr:MBOAT family protein [Clostridiaceae bacterium]